MKAEADIQHPWQVGKDLHSAKQALAPMLLPSP
jgi:hypothetical protein